MESNPIVIHQFRGGEVDLALRKLNQGTLSHTLLNASALDTSSHARQPTLDGSH